MGPLGELGALFNPGMRHEIEEQQSKANRREEEGNARDGDLRIDLASGVAVINMAKGADHPAAPAAGDTQQPESAGGSAADAAGSDTAESDQDPHRGKVSTEPADAAPPPETVVTTLGAPAQAASPDAAVSFKAAPAETASSEAASSEVAPADPGAVSLTAAQVRRVAAAARRSAGGDRPARPVTPRPANAQLPSSKASRAAR